MADMEVLERRVVTALLGYVSEVPVDVDAAAVARRVALEHPRGQGSRIGWRPVAVPRVAWLLLAALLVAMAGVLVAGAQPEPKLPAIVPPVSQVATCPPGSTPDEPGPIDQARPAKDPVDGAMAFDRRAGRIVKLVEQGINWMTPAQTWTFDVCTNTWTRMRDGPAGADADAIVYAANADRTIAFGATTGNVWAYDLARDTWQEKGPAPLACAADARSRLVYDAASGNVILAYKASGRDCPDLWSYDVERDHWTALTADGSTTHGFTSNALLAYDTAVDRLVVYDWGENNRVATRLFDLRERMWRDAAGGAPKIRINWFTTGSEIAYDEASRRTVILNIGRVDAYDAIADRWTLVSEESDTTDAYLCAGPHCRSYATTIYDPVNERLVVYGGAYELPGSGAGTGMVRDDGVLAYDLATGTWIDLLEPSAVEPWD